MHFRSILIVACCWTFSSQAQPLCQQWDYKQEITQLPFTSLPEVSGMAISPNIPGRAYFVNDSGDGPHFYSYDLGSGNYQKVVISGFKGWDVEALSFGPCGKKSCLYVADIGDNLNRRKIVRIAAIVERDHYPDSITPLVHKILTYPDEAKDAEGLVVSKRGDIYLFSKEFGLLSSGPTRVYYLSSKKFFKSGQAEFEKLGSFNLSGMLIHPLLTVTDAALSPDNSRLFLLGYLHSYELSFDDLLKRLSPTKTLEFSVYNEVSLNTFVDQSEAVSYSPDGLEILWTYESKKSDAPLLQKTCLD